MGNRDGEGGEANGDAGNGAAGSGGASDGGEAAGAIGGAPPGICNDGKGAVISGRVLSPSGQLPLGGVTVYVPSSTVDALPNGIGCFRCANAFIGVPIAKATTGADGWFELANVPVGEHVPLVVQTGKWRRTLELNVADCRENAADEDATRLPRDHTEGNLPLMALVSGGQDTLECLLRKLGVADSEFAFEQDGGRVRLFRGEGGIAQLAGVVEAELPPAQDVWQEASKFDLILLGSEPTENAAGKPQASLAALHEYASKGGRVLVQHLQNYFLSAGPSDVASLITFKAAADLSEPFTVRVDEGSPRGQSLAASLLAADPRGTPGAFTLEAGKSRVQAVKAPAVRLLYSAAPATVQAFSVDLPHGADAASCGRITETDLLTGAGDRIADFPEGCSSSGLSAQERALSYLIFDLGACMP